MHQFSDLFINDVLKLDVKCQESCLPRVPSVRNVKQRLSVNIVHVAEFYLSVKSNLSQLVIHV